MGFGAGGTVQIWAPRNFTFQLRSFPINGPQTFLAGW